jgi:hypothetical protein
MYISEIAPLNLRGGLGTINQLAVTVGLLTGQVFYIKMRIVELSYRQRRIQRRGIYH